MATDAVGNPATLLVRAAEVTTQQPYNPTQQLAVNAIVATKTTVNGPVAVAGGPDVAAAKIGFAELMNGPVGM